MRSSLTKFNFAMNLPKVFRWLAGLFVETRKQTKAHHLSFSHANDPIERTAEQKTENIGEGQ